MMISKHTVLCLALLASTAACSSGGGGSSTPATTSGGGGGGATASGGGGGSTTGGGGGTTTTPPPAQGNSFTTAATSPDGIAINNLQGPTMDSTSATRTGTAGGPDDTLHININASGITYQHDFALANAVAAGGVFTTAGGQFSAVVENQNANDGSFEHNVIFDPSLKFSTYGVWQHNTPDKTDGIGDSGAFATGQLTPAAQLPAGTASYSGGAVGLATNGTNSVGLVGTSNINVNFDSRTVDASLALQQQTFDRAANGGAGAVTTTSFGTLTSSGAAITPGTAVYAGNIGGSVANTATHGTDAVTGKMSGAFYGPAAAETAGVFSVTGGATTAHGSFGGTKQ